MNTIDPNPYAPPSAESLPVLLPKMQSGFFYHDGTYLVVSNHAELPLRCVLTNQDAERDGWRKRTPISWTPPWVYLTVLAGFLIAIILILVIQKKAKITYSLSSEGRRRIRKKQITGWLLLAGAVGLFFAAANFQESSPLVGISIVLGAFSLIASLIVFVISNPVKAVKHSDGWFRVKGCCPEFLASLPPMPNSPF